MKNAALTLGTLLCAGMAFAQQLPPATPAPAVEEKPAQAAEAEVSAEDIATLLDQVGKDQSREQVYSYGAVPYSLMFTGEQVTAMKNVLQKVESRKRDGGEQLSDADLGRETLLPFLQQETSATTGEPASYPVFFLSSIAYRSASDWAVWMGRTRITPKNNKPPLEVASISRDQVTFHWKPDYFQQIVQRKTSDGFAPVKDIKHRLADASAATFAPELGAIVFTLRPNQSFSAAHMHIFEGKVQEVALSEPEVTLEGRESNKSLSDSESALLDDMVGPGVVHGGPPVEKTNEVNEKAVQALQQLMAQQKSLTSSPLVSTPHAQPAPQAP